MSVLSEEEIRAAFPSLKCVFYGAGTVQTFARPFLKCGVKVFSAWVANAVPVAEYTVSQILLANKGFFTTSRLMRVGDVAESHRVRSLYPGNFGASVGLIGVGQVARAVIRLLKNFKLHVKVYDPFLSREDAAALGVEQCDLEELFATCHVVSNHVANNASTQGMLRKEHFTAMLPNATFLNTGRGAQVVEEDLVQVLRQRPDLTAVLDVTWPEPPVAGHPFYSLPNCVLTPHIAGSSGQEVHRMAEYMAEEFELYAAGKPCRYEVTLEMLKTMA
jgi:phosphoglycerate dehydrogenase-like enzyme